MKALFLAGGKGTRLRPITNELPKPMVPVMGKPLLERNIERLKEHGVDEIVLSTCYKPYKIEKYFGSGEKTGVKVNYISEDIPLGTAGAIKNAQEFFKDTFIVFNADILSDIDISDMIKYHKKKKAFATIATTEVEDPSAYGVIEYDKKGFVTAFKEKPKHHETTSNLINAGIYIFEPGLFDEIPLDKSVSIERETYPRLLNKGKKIAVYNKCSYWLDLGTPDKYIKAHKDILNGDLKMLAHNFKNNPKYISSTAKIHPNAKIIDPVYIEDNVEIGAFAVVGPNTFLGENSHVGVGSKVIGSVVWDHASVGNGALIANSVIMSNCKVDMNTEEYNIILTQNVCHSIAV
ncbi:NDP-sugar synthase [Herbivorax sp. ANBcel31]|uniref:nucleotidyltransferase family protein n=1 Tax=Herbivorax sp. ANBcel31 TaxID=3069754 RepID=UPI0027B17B2B|nr:NDP-sugar synthase [Herbivorax sp. ANBcel31]MDQ2087316.1 NDP-sugar synthase [Herbivorax sp. ANBcel31]